MLDQLVESKNNETKNARGGFLLTTAVLVVSLFASGILWSLFARDLGGQENLEFSLLATPVQLPEDTPRPPEPVKIKPDQSQKVESSLPVRNDNIARMDESQSTPDKILTTQSNQKARPQGDFKIDRDAIETDGSSPTGRINERVGTGPGIASNPNEEKPETEEVQPPPTIKKKEEPKVDTKPKGPIKVSQILNGQARSLPIPAYPPAAKAIRAYGDVNVQVTIDETGSVISANSVGGHALLRQSAENAARRAKFSPTLLNGQPVKVTGIIVYKFAMQ